MRLGYELIKEQLFFRKELIERVSWFIRLRWVAVGIGLAGILGLYLFWPQAPVLPIFWALLGLLGINGIYDKVCRVLKGQTPLEVGHYILFAHIQITIDLLVLFIIIFLTGGIGSPFLMFTLFHIIIAGFLLSAISSFAYGSICIGLIALQIGLKLPAGKFNILQSLTQFQPVWAEHALVFLVFTMVILITAMLTTTIKKSLRTKGRELLAVSKELDSQNAKLTALYNMIKDIGVYADLKNMMDAATRQAARIMGVKGCSIKLLDEQRQKLLFASTFGLSPHYVKKGAVDIEKSPINKKIIQGSYYAVSQVDEKESFQFPEDLANEGIASMVCLPLRVDKVILGAFCVYSQKTHSFNDKDIEFFSLMSDLTALAIENLRNELDKSWFLQKAAHQLRSPSVAIYSMVKTLKEGYLGSLSPEQTATLARCEKRLMMLSDLINTLLDLSIKRSTLAKVQLHPVELASAIQTVISVYEVQAAQKGLTLSFLPYDNIPLVMAEESLLDDLFGNLISNAVKYTPQAGMVTIELGIASDGRVKCKVADTGIGIPEEDLSLLFSEFFRARNARDLEEAGNGLGLTIIKEILDRLRGSITVESKLGQGTVFTVYLPRADQTI